MKNFRQYTDDELVTLYVDGVNEAFDMLLLRHKDRLFTYILIQVHDEDIANDIFQETFMKVIVCLKEGRYTMTNRFYSWISCIAKNLVFDRFRSRQTEDGVCQKDLQNILYGNEHEEPDGEKRERELEQCMLEMKGLIDKLPETQQEVVRMHYFQNKSFKDIALQKNISINTALGRMHYAINNMRRMASKQHFEPYV